MLKRVLVCFILIGCSSTNNDQIPPAFHGVWDKSEQACNEQFSDMRLSITPSTIEYWESNSRLLAINASTASSFTATLEMRGEGTSWTQQNKYVLKGQNNSLVQILKDQTTVTRIPCIGIESR